MTESTMICGDVDERLPDYLEGTLDETTRRRVRQHVATCSRCASLIAELEDIRASAAALPELKPSRDLWAGIADRIETPVIALGTTDMPVRRGMPGWLIGAIAAGLVFATAGITHVLTRQSMERQFASTGRVTESAVIPRAESTATVDTAVPAPRTIRAVASIPAATPAAEARRSQAAAAPVQLVARSAADVTYNREIERLRDVLRQRRAQLDPETVTVIEQSLRVIDDAIAQSRAALAKDPASAFLRDQLDSSLEKKVDLLRTAALLPART